MKIDICPNLDQIRAYAKSALNVWDVLPPDLARDNVIASMEALLHYLDACDAGNGVVVLGVRKIERGIRLEVSGRDSQIVDLTDRYAGDRDIAHSPGDFQDTAAVNVHDVRTHRDGRTADPEIDLASLAERGAQ